MYTWSILVANKQLRRVPKCLYTVRQQDSQTGQQTDRHL